MSMYADPDSRGGILEPAGITEVKFRSQDQVKVMHRLDAQLQLLDNELEMTDSLDEDAQSAIKENISARENELKSVYLQAATEFADLHDKTGRMKAKGVIKAAVPWAQSREFFFYLAKRRMLQDDYIGRLTAADPLIDTESAENIIKSIVSVDWENDQVVLEFFNSNESDIEAKIASVKKSAIERQIEVLQKELSGI